LLVLNVLLGGVGLFCLAFVVQQLVWAPSPPTARPRPATPSNSPLGGTPEPPRPPASAYNIIAGRSVFSPTRSEAPTAGASAPLVGSKPNLQGVVLRDANPIAYLEDPLTKRVSGYRIGDTIAGGKLEQINADHVVISRPDGNIDVRLRDPSKPRPAPPAQPGQPGAAPGVPAAPPPATQPGLIPPRVMVPQQPVPQPQGPPINRLLPPGRRLPPGLGSGLPLPPASEAIQQPPQPQQ
jgi:hypothetical protein